MQPASTTNLSFHSSSDGYEVRPVYVDYDEASNTTASSATTASLPSANFASPISAGSYDLSASQSFVGGGLPPQLPRKHRLSFLGDALGLQRRTAPPTVPTSRPTSRQPSMDINPDLPPMRPRAPATPLFTNAAAAAERSSSGLLQQSASSGSQVPQINFGMSAPSFDAAANNNTHNSNNTNAAAAAAGGGRGSGADGGGWYASAMNTVNHYLDQLLNPDGGAGDSYGRSRMEPFAVTPSSDDHDPFSGIHRSRSPFGSEAGAFNGVAHRNNRNNNNNNTTAVPSNNNNRRQPLRAERVVVDAFEPIAPPPMVQLVQNATEEEQLLDEATDVDDDPHNIEVDLVSALQGYREEPSECYGHLVAAALTTRSAERPVTGQELRAADRNPFLVRLVINSTHLDLDDPVAQEEVQGTVDQLIALHTGHVTPALYEYLCCFLTVQSVRLSQAQYTSLKSSGFEYITLMYSNQHTLPKTRYHSILVNYSMKMAVVGLFFVILGIASIICCTVTIGLVLAYWMTSEQSPDTSVGFGFYTLIVFGCGYAINLIFMIFFLRTRQNELVYEDTGSLQLPSPYVNVIPVLPIFDILCLVTYLRSLRRKKIAFSHNVLACSRLSCISYAMCFGIPQLICQSYFNHTTQAMPEELQNDWRYLMLKVTVLVQWGVALFRFAWMMLAYDSTNGLGFACFCIRHVWESIERHSGVPHIMHYIMVYVLETNVYLIIAVSESYGDMRNCSFLPLSILATSGASIFICAVVYLLLWFSSFPVVRISFACIPVGLLQVAIYVLSLLRGSGNCSEVLDHFIFKDGFIFGYITWIAFLCIFVLWLAFIIMWKLWGSGVKLPRFLWRYAAYSAPPQRDKTPSGISSTTRGSVSTRTH